MTDIEVNPNEAAYLTMAKEILFTGDVMEQRAQLSDGSRPTTRSLFGYELRLDLRRGFPLLTTKKMSLAAVTAELVWFISGSTSARTLEALGTKIWSAWADEHGELGSVYGKHWRDWAGAGQRDFSDACTSRHVVPVDQLMNLERDITSVIRDPNHSSARRLLLINYNPGDLPPKAPPGCHTLVQFSVRKGRLDCKFYMRSADTFLGVPYNIASYALLNHAMANVHGLTPGYLVVGFGDVHIYSNHYEQMRDQTARRPYPPPRLVLGRKLKSILDLSTSDVTLSDYQCHPALKGEVAV